MLDVRRSSRSELGCRLVAICVTWAFLIPKRLLRNALRQSLRTSGIFLHWQRIGRCGGTADDAERKGRGGGGLSGRGGASLGSSGCGAVPSHCRGGATSCASEGTGRMVRGGGPARRIKTTRLAGGLLFGYNPRKAGARLKTPAFTLFRPYCP